MLGIRPAVPGLARYRTAQIAHVVAQVVHESLGLRAPLGAPALFHAVEDFVDLRLALVHEAPTGLGDAVHLAAVLLDGTDISHVLEHL